MWDDRDVRVNLRDDTSAAVIERAGESADATLDWIDRALIGWAESDAATIWDYLATLEVMPK